MTCAECRKADLRSKVFAGHASTTALHSPEFWDENGVRHRHNRNIATRKYHCSNGHFWTEKTRYPCPATGCKWPESSEEPAR